MPSELADVTIDIAGIPEFQKHLATAAGTISAMRDLLQACEPHVACPHCGARYSAGPCGPAHEANWRLFSGDADGTEVQPREWAGSCVITWPRTGPGGVLAGWAVTVTDAATGKHINTGTAITTHLHATPEDVVWADLTLFADEDGKPIYDGPPVLKDGKIITRVFPFQVSEMRIAGP